MEGARNWARDRSKHSRQVSSFFPHRNPERWHGCFSTEETEAQGISGTCPRSCIGDRIRALCTKPWSLPS